MTLRAQIRILVLMLLVACGWQCAWAQEATCERPLRPVATMFTAQYGHASVLDTYLSPVRYGGHAMSLGYEAQQATGFAPEVEE